MKLLTFQTEDKQGLQLGVKTSKGILDARKASEIFRGKTRSVPLSIEEVLGMGGDALAALQELVEVALDRGDEALFLDEETLSLGPCVPNPGKIICVGTNYQRHAEESNLPVPPDPLLFSKFSNTVAAHQEDIYLPRRSTKVDYEAELGIVIGKRAKYVSTEEALDYVFGYCNINDLSARDLQFHSSQWLLGKTCDGFNPMGPYVITADEIQNPDNLSIRCFVNGEMRQNSNTSDMIFNCAEIISYASQHMTLEPGDVISTGTPEGVILGYPKEKQVWLKDGDEVIIEVEHLGRLVNRMKDEPGHAR